MTIEETKDTISLWIRSCLTSEQLDLLKRVVIDFIADDRFSIKPERILEVREQLLFAIEEKREDVVIRNQPIFIHHPINHPNQCRLPYQST